jgi:hypothetical protein
LPIGGTLMKTIHLNCRLQDTAFRKKTGNCFGSWMTSKPQPTPQFDRGLSSCRYFVDVDHCWSISITIYEIRCSEYRTVIRDWPISKNCRMLFRPLNDLTDQIRRGPSRPEQTRVSFLPVLRFRRSPVY